MGIEPTDRMISIRPDGFEDRGQHQLCIHFQIKTEKRFANSTTLLGQRSYEGGLAAISTNDCILILTSPTLLESLD